MGNDDFFIHLLNVVLLTITNREAASVNTSEDDVAYCRDIELMTFAGRDITGVLPRAAEICNELPSEFGCLASLN